MPATTTTATVNPDDTSMTVTDANEFDMPVPFAAYLGTEAILVVQGPPGSTTWFLQRASQGQQPVLSQTLFKSIDPAGFGASDEGFIWLRDDTGGDEVLTADGEKGTIEFTVAGATANPYLEIESKPPDVEVTMEITIPVAPSSDGIEIATLLREQGDGDHYRARCIINSDLSVDARITKIVSAASTNLGSLTDASLTIAAGDHLHLRAQAFGASPTTIRHKMWLNEDEEPAAWLMSETDSEAVLQNPGYVGMRATSGASLSNIPFFLEVRDFVVRATAVGQTWSSGTAVTAVDPWAYPHPLFAVGAGAPTAIAPEGALYFDTDALTLWVRTAGAWYESGAFT